MELQPGLDMTPEERFPLFAGRAREVARLEPLLTKRVAPVFEPFYGDTWRKFLHESYDLAVPFHGPVHPMYGLLWLAHIGVPIDLFEAWIGHDALHTGDRTESPEGRSANALRHWAGTDQFRDALMHTVFPYAEMQGKTPLDWVPKPATSIAGAWLRRTDTLRGYTGGDDDFARVLGVDDPTIVGLFESLGYGYELTVAGTFDSVQDWFLKGQADFFPEQLLAGIETGVFGPPHELNDFRKAVVLTRRWWKSTCRDLPNQLFELYEFWLGDVTLPEFAKEFRRLDL